MFFISERIWGIQISTNYYEVVSGRPVSGILVVLRGEFLFLGEEEVANLLERLAPRLGQVDSQEHPGETEDGIHPKNDVGVEEVGEHREGGVDDEGEERVGGDCDAVANGAHRERNQLSRQQPGDGTVSELVEEDIDEQ